MDPRLFEVCWTGNVPSLHSLLKTDPFILYDVVLSSSNTPLHVACMPGHLHFVQEILKLRPDFAGELNQDGFSPLHIASANGHVQIVKELLNFNPKFSLIVGREGTVPLHNAVVKGKVNVIMKLLGASVESIEFTTAQGETALHLALRNNQFSAFKLLVEHAMKFNKEGVLSKEDNQGNTILHLAVSKKQYEVLELLLNGRMVSRDKIEVNSINGRGLTPLDVLQPFQSDAGDREIEEILKRAGALKASNLTSTFPDPSITASNVQPLARSQSRIGAVSLVTNIADNTPTDVRNILLIVAILITTATYQAMITPPGGLFQDGDNAGMAILALKSPYGYKGFIVCNTIGFFISILMIYFLTSSFPFRVELYIGLFAMVGTYDSCLYQSTPKSPLMNGLVLILTVFFPAIAPFAMMFLRKLFV